MTVYKMMDKVEAILCINGVIYSPTLIDIHVDNLAHKHILMSITNFYTCQAIRFLKELLMIKVFMLEFPSSSGKKKSPLLYIESLVAIATRTGFTKDLKNLKFKIKLETNTTGLHILSENDKSTPN